LAGLQVIAAKWDPQVYYKNSFWTWGPLEFNEALVNKNILTGPDIADEFQVFHMTDKQNCLTSQEITQQDNLENLVEVYIASFE